MISIDKKYIIPEIGKYTKAIWVCPYCNHDIGYANYFNHIKGIAMAYVGVVAIVECPQCFESYYSHIDQNYEYFVESVETGENIHFNKPQGEPHDN